MQVSGDLETLVRICGLVVTEGHRWESMQIIGDKGAWVGVCAGGRQSRPWAVGARVGTGLWSMLWLLFGIPGLGLFKTATLF